MIHLITSQKKLSWYKGCCGNTVRKKCGLNLGFHKIQVIEIFFWSHRNDTVDLFYGTVNLLQSKMYPQVHEETFGGDGYVYYL